MSETLTLSIDGMTCASCVARVERALKAVPGVEGASVNLATQTARVALAPGGAELEPLAAAVKRAGYAASLKPADAPRTDDPHKAEAEALRRKVILASILTLPVFVLAMGTHAVPAFHHWIMGTIGERGSALIHMVLTAAVLLGPGRVFLTTGIPALFRGAPEMNALVALGSLAAFGYSAVATLVPALLPEHARAVYFEAAAVIVTLILVGRMLEARAKGQAGQAIRRLAGLRPDTATVRRPSGTRSLPLADILPGDILLIAPGERIALDGVVTEGTGFVDEAMLTGEPIPAAKAPGSTVTGGTVNGTSALSVRVTATGEDTVLARILSLVEDAQSTKLPVQALVDRITLWFVPVVIAIALAAFLGWYAFGPDPALTNALVAAISVLIIACPCAMGLATPVSILVGTGRGAELGLLFRRGDALQRLSETAIVAFDKTGTLTEGHPAVTDIVAIDGTDGSQALTVTAAAEARSEHPLALAIVAAAMARGLSLPEASRAEALPGRGLLAEVAGREVRVGSLTALREAGITTAEADSTAEGFARQGKTPVLVSIDGKAALLLAIADRVKPGAPAAVRALLAAGHRVAMISGDNPVTANAIAAGLGITEVTAGVLPEGKVEAVAALKRSGTVAFVGDGINDAPALAAADVGVAIGGGTDIAIEAAEVVLMTGDPRAVSDAIRLSQATMRNIRQNLVWAFGYNAALIPVAAGALYPVTGTLLSPMLAAGAMALSSVFVVTNALRLRRVGPWAAPQAATASTPSGTLAPVMKATASDIE